MSQNHVSTSNGWYVSL